MVLYNMLIYSISRMNYFSHRNSLYMDICMHACMHINTHTTIYTYTHLDARIRHTF